MRDSKLYLQFAPSWGAYCLEFLKVTGRHTNRQIACLNEFGPGYFELAQITGITPAVFRRIAPAVRSDGIHVGGEIIALIPANAEKTAQAVACLLLAEADAEAKAEAKAPPRPDVTLQIAALERRGRQVANTLASLAKSDLSVRHRQALLNTVQDVRLALLRVEMAML
jgi:hypothetical protein